MTLLDFDATTGLLTRLGSVQLLLQATLVTGGHDVRLPLRGIGYEGTVALSDFKRTAEPVRHRIDGTADVYTVVTSVGDWTVAWEYTVRHTHPRVALAVEITGPGVLRDLLLEFSSPMAGRIEAPGNEIRPGTALAELTEPIVVSTAGGFMGSSGLVAAHDDSQTLVIWPICRTEIGHCTIRGGDGLHLTLDTGLAGQLDGQTLRYEAIHLDALDTGWEETRALVPSWYRGLGISTPADRPDWVLSATIYEVHVGRAPFSNGYGYEPYPDLAALRADLDRIAGLGFDVLQLMPRHPYPSYNVHGYEDIATTYGAEEELRDLVTACHDRGMRIILDVLMHGVIDQEVMARTAQQIRDSDFYARLGEDTTSSQGTSAAAKTAELISWARHILDFEPYWMAAPKHHQLVDEHPEWFMRDSAQEIIGIYTKAFDVANTDWQDYFCAAMENLVRRLDVDGFRIDAPTYNDLPNWSAQTRRRASYSPLGCLELFDRLRPRLKRLKESLMLYTEPTGVLFRQAMDVTYNYDEQWLIPSVLDGGVIRSGRELAAWLADRDAVLPPGSLIAHHIDSHDTFWWPLPGQKWRREQHGLAATKALLAVFALNGGAFMTYVGGETGIEDELRQVLELRRRMGGASVEYDLAGEESVFAVVRRTQDQAWLVRVNLSAEPAGDLAPYEVRVTNCSEEER
ncbi:alpha-amylase family glycosyl hydrolase [Kribbella sp. NPDC051586]|uniref:alpha-amylase family glycosyl hydrolase n=1 Tax=Kribbella sp. NPDC051586 TaxID=3364118 RepID=UPI00378DF5F7